MNLFKLAITEKWVFHTKVGNLKAEDLCDLPLTSKNKLSLNDVAVEISKSITKVEDFVGLVDTTNTLAKNKLELVKLIIADKKQALVMEANKNKKDQEIRFFEELLARKETEAKMEMSEEEIIKRLAELKG